MAATAAAELIAELERTVRARPDRTTQVLRGIANLLAATAGRLDRGQLDVFDEILIRLAGCVELPALAQLSAALADVPCGQLKVVQRLARHEEPAVAAPILQRSEQLSDEDLVEIAACCSAMHGSAIAQRRQIPEAIVNVLLDHADTHLCIQLARNCGARFSQVGYARFARLAARNDALADLLVIRCDVPTEVLHELLSGVPRSVRARLLGIAAPELRETIKDVIESIEATACAKAPETIDYSEAQATIIELNKSGKLNDSTVNRFATWREYRNVVVALSQLATVPIQTVAPLLHESDCYGLIVACRASRLNWNTTLAVISNRPDRKRPTEEEIEKAQAAFEALNLSAAQRLIRFGSVRDFAQKCQAAADAPVGEAG